MSRYLASRLEYIFEIALCVCEFLLHVALFLLEGD